MPPVVETCKLNLNFMESAFNIAATDRAWETMEGYEIKLLFNIILINIQYI